MLYNYTFIDYTCFGREIATCLKLFIEAAQLNRIVLLSIDCEQIS